MNMNIEELLAAEQALIRHRSKTLREQIRLKALWDSRHPRNWAFPGENVHYNPMALDLPDDLGLV